MLLLVSCTGEAGDNPEERAPATEPSVTRVPKDACPVTLANGVSPPGQPSHLSYGNGRLWVELYPQGQVRAHSDDVRPDGSLAIKFPWTRGVRGQLTITGRRLGTTAPPLRAWIPDGYGRIGFQSTAVIFPTPGCWQVTGTVGRVSLTFVTMVKGPAVA